MNRSPDVARLEAHPRAALGSWPTPIERYDDPVLGPILVKRDDLSGWGRGGAKARKIEHLIGHLHARRRDALITVAGNVTNLAFDLIPAVDRFGIEAHLFIQDDPPTRPPHREAIFSGIRDRVRLVGRSRLRTLAAAMAAYGRARARGRRPFLLLPGAIHPAAVAGNALGFLEMAGQRLGAGEALPRTVFITAATGTTLAGFLIGAEILRNAGHARIRVRGVQVYPGAVEARTRAVLRWTERALRLDARVPGHTISIDRSALHGGFGSFPGVLAQLCHDVSANTGPVLDPIFGGKTWAAMQRTVTADPSRGRSSSGRVPGRVLYWHCGYTPEWETLGRVVPEKGSS